MEEKKYIINVGDFMVDETTYPNRCLSASFGGNGVESEIIPWADTEYNPWDYKYENGEFVLDVLPDRLKTAEEEIAELKQFLNNTDYVVIKIAEGVANELDYADVITQRAEARQRINELEAVTDEL